LEFFNRIEPNPDRHKGAEKYLFGLHARAGIAKGTDAPGKTTGYLKVGRSF
jgi:hypothetical protein